MVLLVKSMTVTEARADVGLGFYKITLKEKMSSLCSNEGNEDNCSEILSEPKEKGCCVPDRAVTNEDTLAEDLAGRQRGE